MKPACLLIALALSNTAWAETLTVRVTTKSDEGTVQVGVFRSQAEFDNYHSPAGIIGGIAGAVRRAGADSETDQPAALIVQQAVAGDMQFVFPDLKPGTYGIAAFQDTNGNNKLDTFPLYGFPTEPFGFSRNPMILFSAPGFDTFKFEFTGRPTLVPITLKTYLF